MAYFYESRVEFFYTPHNCVNDLNNIFLCFRPRGIVKEWRMSRIVWRHLADYNKLSGVQRAMWG